MLLALAGVSSVAMAQQKTEVVEEFGVIQVQDKYQVITNPFWSNWFFSIGGGAEATFGDNDKAGSFGKRISPTLNFAIGKWFTRDWEYVCNIAAFRQEDIRMMQVLTT